MNRTCRLYLPAFAIVVWAVIAELTRLSQPVTGFALFTIAVAMKIQVDESVRRYQERKENGELRKHEARERKGNRVNEKI